MDLEYAPATKPASADYVLAVLRDEYRLQCCHDPEAEPNIDLTFVSTVDEWRNACDLVPWRPLGQALNASWGIDCSEQEWSRVLEPPRRRRLAEVCALIAAHAVKPSVRPAHLLGKRCGSAGAFRTIRWLLHEAGAPVLGLKPSSPLATFARSHPAVFLDGIPRLAPGALPPVSINDPAYDRMIHRTMLLILGGWVLGWIGAYLASYPIIIVAVVLFAAGHVGCRYAAPRLPPASVEFEGLLTFRDLAIAIDRAQPV